MSNFELLINHPDYEVSIKEMNLLVKDGVFTPDSAITNSSSIILNNLPNVKGKESLDVGSGTGVIGLYCGLKGAKKIVLIDIDDKALQNTRENVTRYKLRGKIDIFKSDLFKNVKGSFHYIFANLPMYDDVWNINSSTQDLIKRFIFDCKNYIKKEGNI